MKNEILLATICAFISAIVSGIVSIITTVLVERHKEKRILLKEKREARRDAFFKRPEMEIIEHKNYLSRQGYGISKQCDIELFIASPEQIVNQEEKTVYLKYRQEDFDRSRWCCVIYTLKNVGKTGISALDIISNRIHHVCVIPIHLFSEDRNNPSIDTSFCYDKKIREEGTITLKLCFNSDHIIRNGMSASLSIGMEDTNGCCWLQPLWAPENKVYDSYSVSKKEFLEKLDGISR